MTIKGAYLDLKEPYDYSASIDRMLEGAEMTQKKSDLTQKSIKFGDNMIEPPPITMFFGLGGGILLSLFFCAYATSAHISATAYVLGILGIGFGSVGGGMALDLTCGHLLAKHSLKKQIQKEDGKIEHFFKDIIHFRSPLLSEKQEISEKIEKLRTENPEHSFLVFRDQYSEEYHWPGKE